MSRRAALTGLDEGATRADALAALRCAFAEAGVEYPALDARLILCAAGRFAAEDLIRAPEAVLDVVSLARLSAMAARRIAREPSSRILGRRDFWSLSLNARPGAFDPRPETETLVEAALQAFAERRNESLRILDLGSGSGPILCALLSEFPNAYGVALDLSPAAAALSGANLVRSGASERASVVVGRWGEALADQRFDIVVSNPPYVASAAIASLPPEVRCYDPSLALDGGHDGLDAYRALAAVLGRLLEPAAGRFFLEIGVGQADAVAAILSAAGLGPLALKRDLAGRARAICGGINADLTLFEEASWRGAKKRLVLILESSSPRSPSESREAADARDAGAIERLRLTKSRETGTAREKRGQLASI